MIQLERQQHEEFEGGWGGGLHQLPISSLLGLDQKIELIIEENQPCLTYMTSGICHSYIFQYGCQKKR